MKSCKSEVNLWYLDDGTVCGDPKTVQEDLQRILEASNPLGLSVNSEKCEIFTITGSGRNEPRWHPESFGQPSARHAKDQDGEEKEACYYWEPPYVRKQ